MYRHGRRIEGRVALVTGASAGIGRAVAIALASEGAHIIATGRREPELHSLAAQCAERGGSAVYLAGDVTDTAFVARLADRACDADILINNAGILTYAPLMAMTASQCESMFRVNVLAAIEVSQRMGEHMATRGRGHIVMMSSLAARRIGPMGSVYGASKHAIAGFTKGLRMGLHEHGIKVTEIAPGRVSTDIRNASTHPKFVSELKNVPYVPLTPQDVAQAILYAVTTSDTCCPDLIELRPARCQP